MEKRSQTEILIETSRRTTIRRTATVKRTENSHVTVASAVTTEQDSLRHITRISEELLPQPLRSPEDAAKPCSGGRTAKNQKIICPELSREAWNALLMRLDADPDRAGEKYAVLRLKLMKYFECRGCHTPTELADETINRVARRLGEGEEIRAIEPAQYFYGVARNVLREYQDRRIKQSVSLPISMQELSPTEHPWCDPLAMQRREEELLQSEHQLECLEQCLAQLPAANRALLLAYYEGESRVRIEKRRALAARLGITGNALKIRISRLREMLARRINKLMTQ